MPGRAPSAAQARYDAMVQEMLARYGVKVRKWRSGMSGIARLTTFADGSTRKTIESPRPKGPMSAAVFLHEIGHHAIGLGVHSPRCLEEYHAWTFAITEMRRLNIAVTERVQRRMDRSLRYAVGKARRRGLRKIPPELEPYARPDTHEGPR